MVMKLMHKCSLNTRGRCQTPGKVRGQDLGGFVLQSLSWASCPTLPAGEVKR